MDRRFGSKSLCFLRVLLLHLSLGIMIRLLTINSRGFDSQKEGFVFSLTKSCDFCFVQETFLNDTQGLHAPASRWTGSRFWSPVLGRQGGVAILIDPNNLRGNVTTIFHPSFDWEQVLNKIKRTIPSPDTIRNEGDPWIYERTF